MLPRRILPLVAVVVLAMALPTFAGTVPSKSAPNQSLQARQAEIAKVNQVLAVDGVSQALEAQGFTRDEVASRVASLSDEDLSRLSQNLDQVEAAGLTRAQWTWIGIGALAALIVVAVL